MLVLSLGNLSFVIFHQEINLFCPKDQAQKKTIFGLINEIWPKYKNVILMVKNTIRDNMKDIAISYKDI